MIALGMHLNGPFLSSLFRFGGGDNSPELFLGERDREQQCSREYTDCVYSSCRIQSPNYPGMYPRNTTCTYKIHVRRSDVPKGQHALIELSQPSSQRVSVMAAKVTKYGREDKSLGLWSDCESVGDQVTVYDGKDSNSPVLIVFCRGSAIPQVVSSGRDLFVVFETSPFATPELSPDSSNGFQLEVKVKFVPENSMQYVRNPRQQQCRFEISSYRGPKRGVVTNVAHGLSANTTCVYQFTGKPGEVVWLVFQKFEVVHHKKDIYLTANCLNRLALYDSSPSASRRLQQHQSWRGAGDRKRMGEFCDWSPPKMCDHSYMESFLSKEQSSSSSSSYRACTRWNESYVSTGSDLTLVESVGESTSVTSLNFVIKYEFVDTAQDGVRDESSIFSRNGGEKSREKWSCSRVFRSNAYSRSTSGFPFSSPRNVFLFGRGGKKELRCAYTFVGRSGERVRVSINTLSLGGGKKGGCQSGINLGALPGLCTGGDAPGKLYISEVPDGKTELRQHCICEEIGYGRGLTVVSNTTTLRVEFVVRDMRPDQDYEDFNFAGTFSFVHEPNCHLHKRATGGGGEILLQTANYCNDQPWVIQASQPGKYIFLKAPGWAIYEGPSDAGSLTNSSRSIEKMGERCALRTRIFVYSGDSLTIVCPDFREGRSVELFSDGWGDAKHPLMNEEALKRRYHERLQSSMIVKLMSPQFQQQEGTYLIRWLELSPTPEPADARLTTVFEASAASSSSSCAFACPELSGCIRAELYCDGVRHCPSGFDEIEENCAHVFAPLLYMYAGAAVVCMVVICVIIVVVQKMRARSIMLNAANTAAATTAAYNPAAGANGTLVYGNPHHESITNLTKSNSNGGFYVMEVPPQQQQLLKPQAEAGPT